MSDVCCTGLNQYRVGSIWILAIRRIRQSGKQTEAIEVTDAMEERQDCEGSEAVCGKKNKRGL